VSSRQLWKSWEIEFVRSVQPAVVEVMGDRIRPQSLSNRLD
jgi:hypothetical protein